jgi:tetratricopeptide (TPR) repeat protein
MAITTHTGLSIEDRLRERREEQTEPRDRTYVQLWRELDVGAFGVHAVQADAGKELLPERTADGYAADGHEELYVVLAGSATFTVDGETGEEPRGAAVFVRDPGAKRSIVAQEDGTIVLVVGGRRGEAWRPTPGEAMYDFFPPYREKDYEGALRVAEQVLEAYPGSGLAFYNIACAESLLGRTEDAFSHLKAALKAAPDLVENARTDDDFAAIRHDPRFEKLVG